MSIFDDILADDLNKHFTNRGWYPIYSAPHQAKILIIGQAPGMKAQTSGIMWHDQSGERLRSWLGVDENQFYHSGQFGVLPMDFYYPGKGKSGDLAPRKGIADKWHPVILQEMPNIQMTLLVGSYAQKYYLKLPRNIKTTEVVQHFNTYLPTFSQLFIHHREIIFGFLDIRGLKKMLYLCYVLKWHLFWNSEVKF